MISYWKITEVKENMRTSNQFSKYKNETMRNINIID